LGEVSPVEGIPIHSSFEEDINPDLELVCLGSNVEDTT